MNEAIGAIVSPSTCVHQYGHLGSGEYKNTILILSGSNLYVFWMNDLPKDLLHKGFFVGKNDHKSTSTILCL